MPSLSPTHATLYCNDFQFGYVPVSVPRAYLSKQNGPDSGPVVGFVGLAEKPWVPAEKTHLFSVMFRKQHYSVHSLPVTMCKQIW